MAAKKKKATPIGKMSTSDSYTKAEKRLKASKEAGAAERKARTEEGKTKSGAPSKKQKSSASPAKKQTTPPEKKKRGRPAGSGEESVTLSDSQVNALEKKDAASGRKEAAERNLRETVEAEPTGSEASAMWEEGAGERLGLDTPRGATLLRPRELTDKEKGERARSLILNRRNRRTAARQDLTAGTKPVETNEVTVAVDNDIPAGVQRKRDYPSFPVTPGQAKKRREYLFGEGTAPIVEDVAPVTGVGLTDDNQIKTAGKFLPGNEIGVKTLSRMDTPVKKAAEEAAQMGETAQILADLAKRIPMSVPDDTKQKPQVFTSDTRTSAEVEEGPQPTRSGRLADVISEPAPEGEASSSELLGRAARVLGRGEGRGIVKEVTGALQSGQFSTPGARAVGSSTINPRENVIGGPVLVPQDIPELEAFAARMAQEAPNMPREYDLSVEGPPAVRGGITTGGGLVSGEGYPLREIKPESSPELEAQALKNKRTTPITPIPAKPTPVDTDIEVPETGGTRTERYRAGIEKLNQRMAEDPDFAAAIRPELQAKVDAAMGRAPSRRGRITTTIPRAYSKGNPKNEGMPRAENREGLGVMSSPQTHRFMKAIRRDVGIKGDQTEEEDIRLTQENAGVTRKIERELMGDVPGVGEGKDRRGAQIGTKTGQEIAEAGGNPNENYGQILLGGSQTSGGPKPMTVKVKMAGQDKEGSFVTSQPNIPDVVPTRKNDEGEEEPVPGVVTLPELKVIDPHRGSVFDYVTGAGKSVNVTAGEERPEIPGNVSFTKSIGGRSQVFSTLLSTVKPSGSRLVPRAQGSGFDESGTYINPEKAPKVYDYDYDKQPTAPAVSPETTSGTIIAGAGSLFSPRRGGADIVGTVSGAGTVGTSIPGVAISRGNPIVTDAAAAASNPAIQRAAMRPYRESGIRAAKAEARQIDLHLRGMGAGVAADEFGNPVINDPNLRNQSPAVQSAAITGFKQSRAASARRTDQERSLEEQRRRTGASSGRTVIDTSPEPGLTASQTALRTRAGLPANPNVSLTQMGEALGRVAEMEKSSVSDKFSAIRTPAPASNAVDQSRTRQKNVADVLAGRFAGAGLGFPMG